MRSPKHSILKSLAVAACGVLLLPDVAQAHLVTTGLGPVYDGIWHVLVSPMALLLVAAIAFASGLNGPACGRVAIFVFPAAWLIAAFCGFNALWPAVPDSITGFLLVCIGLSIALDLALPRLAVALMAGGAGAIQGFADGVEVARAGSDAMALPGMAAAMFVLCSIVTGLTVHRAQGVCRLIVRTGGSWIAAVALLTIGWAFRGA